MDACNNQSNLISLETQRIKNFIRGNGIDLVGITDLHRLAGMPTGILADSTFIYENFHFAVVLGAQLNKLGRSATGSEVSLFMEKATMEVMEYLEQKGYPGLIIHTEDEYDPSQRVGLLSLKVLAKGAGLG